MELIPNGSKVAVTNSNKLRYLDALAQYKLANNIKDEVESFLKGLGELIPDNLLSIFDENELEVTISSSLFCQRRFLSNPKLFFMGAGVSFGNGM